MTTTERRYTLGEAAVLIGVLESRLRRAYVEGELPEPPRCVASASLQAEWHRLLVSDAVRDSA